MSKAFTLDKTAIEAAEKRFCAAGRVLREDRTALNVTFDQLAAKSKVFAFSNCEWQLRPYTRYSKDMGARKESDVL